MSGSFTPEEAARITGELAIIEAIRANMSPEPAAGLSVLARGWVQVFATIRMTFTHPDWKLGFGNKPAALAAVSLAEALRSSQGRGERFGATELKTFQALLAALINKAPKVAAYVEPVPWSGLSK